MQSEDSEGRLHAIGRVDSKEGTNIIIVQFFLTAESQAGNPAGVQRSSHDLCRTVSPAIMLEEGHCLFMFSVIVCMALQPFAYGLGLACQEEISLLFW